MWITPVSMEHVKRLLIVCAIFLTTPVFAGTSGSISGSVSDEQGISVGGAQIQILSHDQKVARRVTSGGAGDFEVFPLDFGDYTVQIDAQGFAPFKTEIHIASGVAAQLQAKLVSSQTKEKEMTIEVKAKKNLVSGAAPSSTREVNKEMIQSLPQGDDIKLPKLLATTTPGIVSGPFGQSFIRGNHANIQYQIDGVQLPDSPSSTFGQAFSPRNIDHMEVITGGIPSEYGERLAAVVNIVTKTGSETPGGSAGIGYGTYNTLTPQANYSGSNSAGDFHYYLSGAYTQSDRGLDTPQPSSSSNVKQGGKDAIHDKSNSNDEFVKLDWQLANSDKLTVIVYNSYNFFQIPNFPSTFLSSDPIYSNPDQWGNSWSTFVPSTTNDSQSENNAYIQAVWKHTIDSHSFLQLAPYYKFSNIKVSNDPTNDLFGAVNNLGSSSSLAMNRNTNNFGMKGDYSNRLDDRNLLKSGFQIQTSKSTGTVSVISQPSGGAAVSSSDNNPDTGYFESVYIQDDFTITKPLTLNAGVRADATQFNFSDISTSDSWIQPRIGLSYLVTETTKIHAFYGLLFQPAPVENLRDTFITTGAGSALAPYDIKAEKDNYFEVGVTQQIGEHVLNLNSYYKSAKNMLDDAQLLNTSIAQPYNFSTGYAYGVEFSLNGKISEEWSDYFNYSYEVAKGKGVSGGLFTGISPIPDYQFLDHVQIHTANAGVTYKTDRWWWTGQGLFGSGLRTGSNNTMALPGHFTVDTSVGYDFSGASWWSKSKLSLDIINAFDNVYPITIANGFNGSHYAPGREFFVRLSKQI